MWNIQTVKDYIKALFCWSMVMFVNTKIYFICFLSSGFPGAWLMKQLKELLLSLILLKKTHVFGNILLEGKKIVTFRKYIFEMLRVEKEASTDNLWSGPARWISYALFLLQRDFWCMLSARLYPFRNRRIFKSIINMCSITNVKFFFLFLSVKQFCYVCQLIDFNIIDKQAFLRIHLMCYLWTFLKPRIGCLFLVLYCKYEILSIYLCELWWSTFT